jgi:tetratricopeptide (TPR) repeat protein
MRNVCSLFIVIALTWGTGAVAAAPDPAAASTPKASPSAAAAGSPVVTRSPVMAEKSAGAALRFATPDTGSPPDLAAAAHPGAAPDPAIDAQPATASTPVIDPVTATAGASTTTTPAKPAADPSAAPDPSTNLADAPTPTPTPKTQAQIDIAAYCGMASRSIEDGDQELAEKFYDKMLQVDSPDADKKDALLEMFDSYRTRGIYSKAIAIGERAHRLFPNDPAMVALLVKLGQIYRETGAYQLAIARFYNVLYAALRIDPAEFAKYKVYSTQAQFEIAQTFLDAGDFPQAARTYSMLGRLDLDHDQKAHAEFQLADCCLLLGDYENAEKEARHFLETYADTSYTPQCHYVLCVALAAQHRPQEAADEALTLLRMEKKIEKTDSDTWIYWQKKTGNQLANGFYQQGDFLRALTLYQAMAKLSNDPEWQWPVIYQVGLCLERLRLPDRAGEAYQYILDENKKALDGGKKLTDDLVEMAQMAQWRTEHLEWEQGAEGQLDAILGPRSPADDIGVKVTQTQ